MSVKEQYQQAIRDGDKVNDTSQRLAVDKLDQLAEALLNTDTNWLGNLKRRFPFLPISIEPVKGLYLWGGVGRGKTWLVNLFFDALPFNEKRRIHFHHFMLEIHTRLDQINKQNQSRKQGKNKDPLKIIASEIASSTRIICLDEFIVTNITDAMILSNLLHELFDQGVTLVATSNRVPDDLYLNGLQRERFLPAIDLIYRHLEVHNLDGGIDHRSALLEKSDVYYHPITDDTDSAIRQRLEEISTTPLIDNHTLTILNREILSIACSDDVVWFDFDIICSAPRAAQDYIELAELFGTIVISNVPGLTERDDKTRRFIYLIDELYDRNVKLIMSADAEPTNLYHGTMLDFAFRRTSSRLIEMRSHEYLTRQHNANSSESVNLDQKQTK